MEHIRDLILDYKPDIDEMYLDYLSKYLYSLQYNDALAENMTIEDYIKKILNLYPNFCLYDLNHPIAIKKGSDIKGLRSNEDHCLYVRNNLGKELQDITAFHEIHHAAQTDIENKALGIFQDDILTGRLIMEGQTQYFAELTYSLINNISFENKHIPTEELRLTKFGTVTSNLHNYELYDNLLSKLALLLDVSKMYFVRLNNMNYQEGLKDLQQKYNEARKKYNLSISFTMLMTILDYIYGVDLCSYLENEDKDRLLNGDETKEKYQINKFYQDTLSQKKATHFIKYFDMQIMKAIKSDKVLKVRMSRYIIDDELRFFVKNVLN